MYAVRLIAFLFIVGTFALAACGGMAAEQVMEERVVTITEVVTAMVEVEVERAGAAYEPMGEDLLAALEWDSGDALADAPLSIRQPTRLIIKNATIAVTVAETDRAVDRAVQTAVNFGGYIISQEVWDERDGSRYAELTLAVPVDMFEDAMRSLRSLGGVTYETASGRDVTDEFVDLNSRLENLQATQQRLRAFLDDATTIAETLTVHEELRRVEEQIGLTQGRINYLRDRAAYSIINLELFPLIPTPTVTPTPTPTPTATPVVWQPGETAATAAKQLQRSSQTTADWLIYNGIICGPWLVLLLGLAWLGFRFWRKMEAVGRLVN